MRTAPRQVMGSTKEFGIPMKYPWGYTGEIGFATPDGCHMVVTVATENLRCRCERTDQETQAGQRHGQAQGGRGGGNRKTMGITPFFSSSMINFSTVWFPYAIFFPIVFLWVSWLGNLSHETHMDGVGWDPQFVALWRATHGWNLGKSKGFFC